MNSRDVSAPADASRRLTVYYICALTAVALLSIAGQILVQRQLVRQLSDSTIVNLAGRQRMLGQRACKCAALLSGDVAGTDREKYRDELRDLLPIWRRAHLGLQRGDDALGLPDDESPAAAEVFLRLNPIFETMHAAAERVLSTGDVNSARRASDELLAGEAAYLEGMDAIASLYEQEGRQRVERLRRVERVLLALTLVVLLFEGLFVFRPAARRIRESFADLQRTGRQLLHAKLAAESADRAKSQFLANLSHELRTPLHAILGSTELLRQSPSASDREERLNAIEDSGRMLLLLLNDLLDLSQIEAGKMKLHPQPCELREFALRTTAMFSTTADGRNLELRCLVEDDVPDSVMVDPLRLRQVLANLLNNAVKYTDAGTVTLRIAVRECSRQHVLLEFAVLDTGIGIPSREQVRIFDAFAQLSANETSPRGGVGLGLSIAARLVALMGGKLGVRSELDRGSEFSFGIECALVDADIVGSPAADEDSTVESLQVLAAEDAPAVRRMVEAMLTADGHRSTCVADGRQAVAAFESGEFDLILLDLRMPEIDGLAAAAAMRESEGLRGRRRTPIVALTAVAASTAVNGTSPADFDGILQKPFSAGQLRREIARHFPERRSGKCPIAMEPTRSARVLGRLGGRQHLLDELVELFLNDTPRLLDEMGAACVDEDHSRLKTAAHRLRGQLEMLEIHAPAEIALRLETACETNRWSSIRNDFALITAAWPEIRRNASMLSSSQRGAVVET